ncbi:alpha-2-macroglobulin family protein [Formosa maritima]|uniref:TonB-dependent receptor plug domain-containing protein n=1 Tax=Formosa maritima TaxID=2592046 RepID=A0A5D0GIA4_9FLAO|nr:hypothetical protein [Formosa maritima]TYA57292.1 hypothetical protein FVF61_05140 [Formosa maritima]
MKSNLLSILLLLVTFSISSQVNFSEKTKEFLSENSYLSNVDKEKFYLHTNKTTYYSGEKIWFKAYIVEDSNNKPNLKTNNLFLNFYSPEKKLISSQLFYAEAGFTYGEIDLNPDLISGNYFIDVDTHRNKNFKSGSVIPIQILSTTETITENNTTASITKTSNSSKNNDLYTISFYPESQTILKDEVNNMAFTIKNNQIPVKASGKIIDNATGEIVTRLMSDKYGMGRFNIHYNSNYTAVLNINGVEKSYSLPQANLLGFIIQKKSQVTDQNTFSFLLKTNNATSSNYNNQSLILVLHRDGFAKSVAPIEINKEITSYQINFLKENLFSGINTLTLFDKNNKPISEYSFWNKPENIELDVTQFQASTDSITLNFNMLNKLADANLSISVLPEATISYNNQQNIITEFQLVPYLKETGFNLADYYNETNGNKHSMDLLIQTAIQNTQVQKNIKDESNLVFQSEHGVRIKGSVNYKGKDLSRHQVMLSSTENNILLVKPLKGEKQFEFDSLMLTHPSKYKLALLNEKGEIEKAGFYVYKNFNKYRPDSLLTRTAEVYNKTKFETSYAIEEEYVPLLMDEEVLDEVLIKTKVESDLEILTKRIEDKVVAKGFTQIYVPDEKTFVGADLLFYLKTLPGIQVNYLDVKTVSIQNTRGRRSLLGGPTIYLVFLDDIPMYDQTDLVGIQMFDIASVTINSSGAGFGIRGTGGVIHVYTKTGQLMKGLGEIINPDIQVSETEFGFNTPTETFKNSEIYFPNKSSEELYSTIDWVPNFYLNAKTPNYLTISTEKHQNLKLIINGMNADGQLIYKSITINKESN